MSPASLPRRPHGSDRALRRQNRRRRPPAEPSSRTEWTSSDPPRRSNTHSAIPPSRGSDMEPSQTPTSGGAASVAPGGRPRNLNRSGLQRPSRKATFADRTASAGQHATSPIWFADGAGKTNTGAFGARIADLREPERRKKSPPPAHAWRPEIGRCGSSSAAHPCARTLT